LLNVLTFAMPIEQRPDGEAMPEVVHPWAGTIAGAPQPDLSGQAPEDAMNVLVQQAAALLGDEEGPTAAWTKMRIAPVGLLRSAELVVGCSSPIASDRRMPVTAISPNSVW
jgi:hypothetical protein